ncbi:MAG: hypothetical protein WC761_01460 [Candidatus Paceibacterota bacterium]|jgi:hypothetical protein
MTDEKKNSGQPTEVPEQLNEISLSWAGKLFFAGVASYLAGIGLQKMGGGPPPKLPFKIRGTPEQIKAVTEAILASKSFQEEIKKPGATVESVIQKLNLRNMTKDRFKQLTGKAWPL